MATFSEMEMDQGRQLATVASSLGGREGRGANLRQNWQRLGLRTQRTGSRCRDRAVSQSTAGVYFARWLPQFNNSRIQFSSPRAVLPLGPTFSSPSFSLPRLQPSISSPSPTCSYFLFSLPFFLSPLDPRYVGGSPSNLFGDSALRLGIFRENY